MVTVVDAFNFFKDFGSSEMLVDRELTDMEGDHRTIVNLLTDQIEFADVILLNKIDLVDEDTKLVLERSIKKLNPRAKVVHTINSQVDFKEVINTGLFDYDEAEQSAGWIEELSKPEHTPETDEYGIGSFVFRSIKPFHPVRFWRYIQQNFPATIIRSKGLFWIGSRPNQALTWSQAGGSLKADSAGVWWSRMPYDVRITFASFVHHQKTIEKNWDSIFGDRKNELVFIGQEMEVEQIQKELSECLMDDAELEGIHWEDGVNDDWPMPRAVPPHLQEY